MRGHLAIDFGTSNTLISRWDEDKQDACTIPIPDLAREISGDGRQAAWAIPSLIHYCADGQRWLGRQVLDRQLHDAPQTFRWLKRYIAARNNARRRVHGQSIGFDRAGRDFLASILLFSRQTGPDHQEAVAFTAPVEAFEYYENWLADTAEQAGIHGFRLIDESSAAALGYGLHILPGHVYLVFDFGGGTLDVSVVVIEEDDSACNGRLCRVAGKAGADLGGATVDQWLFHDILSSHGLKDSDPHVGPISRALLAACENIKERLTFQEEVQWDLPLPEGLAARPWRFTRKDFGRLLQANRFEAIIDRTVRRALRQAWDKGFSEEDIQSVLMVGGSSLMPAAQQALVRFFGREKVRMDRPLDAVARGAAAFVSGQAFYDFIQHDYAIRYVDPEQGQYQFHTIVKRGTAYPTRSPVATLSIKASYDQQEQLGLAVFELGSRQAAAGPVELVFDPSGAARLIELDPETQVQRTRFWLNENAPTFLDADPPAQQGDKCFSVDFHVDDNKRLLITARDLRSGRTVMEKRPMVKLS